MTLRDRILRCLAGTTAAPLTGADIAAILQTPLHRVQPILSHLRAEGLVEYGEPRRVLVPRLTRTWTVRQAEPQNAPAGICGKVPDQVTGGFGGEGSATPTRRRRP